MLKLQLLKQLVKNVVLNQFVALAKHNNKLPDDGFFWTETCRNI